MSRRPLNPDGYTTYNKEYYKKYYSTAKGRLVMAKATHKSRCKKLGIPVICTLTYEQFKHIMLDKQKCKCICGKPFLTHKDYEFDHIFPLSKGGGFTADNIQLLCDECNAKKSDEAIAKFAIGITGWQDKPENAKNIIHLTCEMKCGNIHMQSVGGRMFIRKILDTCQGIANSMLKKRGD